MVSDHEDTLREIKCVADQIVGCGMDCGEYKSRYLTGYRQYDRKQDDDLEFMSRFARARRGTQQFHNDLDDSEIRLLTESLLESWFGDSEKAWGKLRTVEQKLTQSKENPSTPEPPAASSGSGTYLKTRAKEEK